MSIDLVWNDLRDRVLSLAPCCTTWKSNQAALLSIYRQADKMGANPLPLLNAPMSSLCDIVPHAKVACGRQDLKTLQNLFDMAGTLSNAELRIMLRGEKRNLVQVITDGTNYAVQLNREQYERLRRTVKLQFEFNELIAVAV